MNKKILLLQFRTDKSLKHERKMIMEKGRFTNGDLKIVNILDKRYKIPKPSDLDKYCAVITGASGQFNITNWDSFTRKRVEQLLPFFKELIKRDFPTLAICFGNQLIARLLGGGIKTDPKQAETGTYEIILTKEGLKSKLFNGIPNKFSVVEGHKDSVVKLPKGATHLAYSKRCKYQAYRYGHNFYGIQFHPELAKKDLIWRIKLYPEYIKLIGKTYEDLDKEYSNIPYAKKIIKNFRNIVEERRAKK